MIKNSLGKTSQYNIEYAASTSGTWDANATSAQTILGSDGAPITGALSQYRIKGVRFSLPVKNTDKLEVQLSDNKLVWIPASMFRSDNGGNIVVNIFNAGNTDFSGVYVSYDSGSTNPRDVRVLFGHYLSYTTNDVTTAWYNGLYWRLAKISQVII